MGKLHAASLAWAISPAGMRDKLEPPLPPATRVNGAVRPPGATSGRHLLDFSRVGGLLSWNSDL